MLNERTKERIIGSTAITASLIILVVVWYTTFTYLTVLRIFTSVSITIILFIIITFAYRLVNRPRERKITLAEIKKKVRCDKDKIET